MTLLLCMLLDWSHAEGQEQPLTHELQAPWPWSGQRLALHLAPPPAQAPGHGQHRVQLQAL